MEESLKNALNADEKLLWSGRPVAFDTLDATHKRSFVVKTAISTAVVVLLLALYIWYALTSGVGVKGFVVIVLLACGAFGPVSTFSDAARLRKNIIYAATDKRLITLRDSAKSVEYDKIPNAELRTDADGKLTLLCGKKGVGARPEKWRAMAVIGPSTVEDSGLCESFAMYALPDAAQFKKAVSAYLPVNG